MANLDIGLGSSNVFELADALAELGTQMLFVTGHSKGMLAEAHQHRPIIAKPFMPDALLAAIDNLKNATLTKKD